MQALRSARSKLESALDEYAQACLALVNRTEYNPTINSLQDLSYSDVNAEIDAFAIVKDKALRMDAILSKARNSLHSLVPISSIPDEVLVRIFRWVMHAESLSFEQIVDEDAFPATTLAISHVCSRWRQVSLHSGSLWSHIDISAHNGVISLGQCFASRSGDRPLSIRIVEPLRRWDLIKPYVEIEDFITSIAPRMESLELACVRPSPRIDMPSVWFQILQHAIFCATNKLTRLAVSDRNVYDDHKQYYSSPAHWFIAVDNRAVEEPEASETGTTILLDDIAQQHYEDTLFNVKVLCLELVFPMWTSRAYHGLTELRLTGPPRLTAIITAQELANILSASPEMRILLLGIELRPTETLPPPVRLEHLEVFMLQSLTSSSQQAILRLILPCGKPLRMSTTYGEAISELPDPGEDEFRKFFRRSSVIQLQVHSSARVLPEHLLQLLPNLNTLILRDTFIFADDTSFSPPRSELSTLHLISCTMHLESLLWLISTKSIREVTIWGGHIFNGESDDFPAENFQVELKQACPVTRILGASDYEHTVKIQGWGGNTIRERMANAQKNNYDLE